MSKLPKELELAIKAREKKKKSKYNQLLSDLGLETEEETRERIKRELDEAYDAVPLETKQKFLDLMWSGKTVGEATRELNIDLMVGSQIIIRNANIMFPTKAIK